MDTKVNIGMFLLDDEVDMHPIMKSTLRKAGFQIEITHDKDEFMRKIKSYDINILGIDHLLVGADTGLDVIKEVKKVNKWSYVIVMSGQRAKGVVEKYLNAGANKYVDKNWTDEELKEILAEYNIVLEYPNYIDVFAQFIKIGMEEAKERVLFYKLIDQHK